MRLRLKRLKSWPWVGVRFLFRPDRAARMFPASALTPVEITACGSPEADHGELLSIFRSGTGSHKWAHYFRAYEGCLAPLRRSPARILEIGVAGGGSLAMWREYFGPQATVVGIDINPECARFDHPADNIFVRIGSQSDTAFLIDVVREFGPFDAIIDDGSHVVSDIAASFGALFTDGLKPGGVYLIEDVHATYWSAYRDRQWSLSDFCASLIDMRHAVYWTAKRSAEFAEDDPARLRSVQVPMLAAMLDRIEVLDSIIAVTKVSRPAKLPVSLRNGERAGLDTVDFQTAARDT